MKNSVLMSTEIGYALSKMQQIKDLGNFICKNVI